LPVSSHQKNLFDFIIKDTAVFVKKYFHFLSFVQGSYGFFQKALTNRKFRDIIMKILPERNDKIMFAIHSVNVDEKRVSVRVQAGLISSLSFGG